MNSRRVLPLKCFLFPIVSAGILEVYKNYVHLSFYDLDFFHENMVSIFKGFCLLGTTVWYLLLQSEINSLHVSFLQ